MGQHHDHLGSPLLQHPGVASVHRTSSTGSWLHAVAVELATQIGVPHATTPQSGCRVNGAGQGGPGAYPDQTSQPPILGACPAVGHEMQPATAFSGACHLPHSSSGGPVEQHLQQRPASAGQPVDRDGCMLPPADSIHVGTLLSLGSSDIQGLMQELQQHGETDSSQHEAPPCQDAQQAPQVGDALCPTTGMPASISPPLLF